MISPCPPLYILQSNFDANAELSSQNTLNSVYNEVAFNEKSAITKENLCTKYTPFTYKDVVLKEKLPITKENLHIFFFVIVRVECISLYMKKENFWSKVSWQTKKLLYLK